MALTPSQVEEVESLLALGKSNRQIERLTCRAQDTIRTIAAGEHRVQRKREHGARDTPIVDCDKHNTVAVDGRCVACAAEEWLAKRQWRLQGGGNAADLALDPAEYCPEALAKAEDHHLRGGSEGDEPAGTRYGRLAENPPITVSPPGR